MRVLDPIACFAQSQPNKMACSDYLGGRSWTYLEFDKAIDLIVTYLLDHLQLNSGDRVVVISKNKVEILLLNYACVRAGLVFVPLNWRLAESELKALIEDARPSALFVDFSISSVESWQDAIDITRLIELASSVPVESKISCDRDWSELSTILYTSGTTGRPKGVMLSEANCFWSSFNFNSGFDVGPSSVFLCDMPMFHTAGLLANCRSAFLAGGSLIVTDGFDAKRTMSILSDPDSGVTHYFSVPQMAQMMWEHPDFDADTFGKNLKTYVWGGAPAAKVMIERFLDQGIPVSNGFGMTEAGSVCNVPVGDNDLILRKAGSVGVASMWDDWFKTGDIAKQDSDGYFYLLDRKKDMYISGGENVYPAEVEACIMRLIGVSEVAVLGIEDEKWGEVGLACVILKTGESVTGQEITDHCLKHLAKYKVPKQVLFVDAIPRTSSGKIQKQELLASITS